ncbi:hypothetical protein AB3X52_16475 [Nocardioides sp. DS6]|uniref:Cellulose synthase n=1 Tax=Nocardioides eburneus TaxID=3231482 RepID=A0ABV3T4P3_9ACTN
MDNASWGALALALTVVAGLWTWFAFRNRGVRSGVRGVAITILPVAAYLTHTLRLFGRIVDAVGDWAVGLVFSPTVWVGIALAGVAFLLLFVSARLPGETRAERRAAKRQARQGTGTGAPPLPAGRAAGGRGRGDDGLGDTLGDDLDDINAILRKHGIS